VKVFEERAKKTGVKPAPLLTRPKLKYQDVEYFEAYEALASGRPPGFTGPGAIPVSEILAYVNLVGIASRDARLKYLRLIQAMDQTYLTFVVEAQKNNKSGR
jgi:hypothetical protein